MPPGQAVPPGQFVRPGQPGQAGAPGAPGVPGPNEARTPPPPANPNTTQNSLLFSELRDNMVVMNDGSFRAVIACKSINFDLMSSKEREGIEYSYQNFLNSLYFPVQILIRSQRVDIGPYIERLTNIRRDQENMLLRKSQGRNQEPRRLRHERTFPDGYQVRTAQHEGAGRTVLQLLQPRHRRP
jgi:hypothetical protein